VHRGLGHSKKAIHTVFALDSSGSMGFNDHIPWNQLIEGVKTFLVHTVRNGNLDDVVSFVIYDDQVRIAIEHMPVQQALDKINSILIFQGDGTEFGPSILKSKEILAKTDLDKYKLKFLSLSDGASHTGSSEIAQLGSELGPKGA